MDRSETHGAPKLTRRSALALTGAAAFTLAAGCQRGGSGFPTKPITMIMPLNAGSAPDVNFRVLAEQAKAPLGQEVVVVNRTGGSGTVGTAELTQAKPDGYTIGMSAVAIVTLMPAIEKNLPFKGPADMVPLLQVFEAPTALAVRADAPWKTLDDFLKDAKQRPEGLRVGMAGRFDLLHFQMERLRELSGANMTLVPFGSGQQIPALLGGTADAAISQPTVQIQHVRAGTMRVLGVFGEKRVATLDVATVKEQGYDITQIPYEFLVAPKGTPENILEKLHSSFKTAMETEAFKDHAQKNNVQISYLSGADLAKKLETDDKIYKDVAQRLGWASQS